MRDTIFISHANPEDNEFSLWLALRLASQGYPVWCDLTKLLGGEHFWSDIESTIRNRTAKFLYVLSRASNNKEGALQELSVAKTVARSAHLHDFIIPLKIDDLPHAETNIRLHHLNAVPFQKGWAVGLRRLIDKLEEDDIARSPAFSPTAVTEWWRSYRSADQGVSQCPEEYLTNWFPISELPEEIHFHRMVRYGGGVTAALDSPPYPTAKHGAYLISFASADDLKSAVSSPDQIVETESCVLASFLDGAFASIPMERREARNYVTNLLRQAWELELGRRELPIYELSGGTKCWYFTQGMAERDRVYFTSVEGRPTFRQVVGYSTVSKRNGVAPTKRYWHFGLQLKALTYPVHAFAAKPHVLFSSDGQTIWDSHRRLHRARRSECKHWWNAEWRDRILAAMTWLADEAANLALPLSPARSLVVSPRPLTITSPVSFVDPKKEESPVDVDFDDWDEFDDDEDDEVEDP